jgi:hypothetical protein
MSQVLGKLLVITVCANLMACTTLHPVADWDPPAASATASSAKGLKPGDHIVVTTTANLTAELDFTRLTADALEGTIGKDKRIVEIPRNQIQGVERREVDALRTTGTVIGVTLTTLAILTTVALSAGGYPALY